LEEGEEEHRVVPTSLSSSKLPWSPRLKAVMVMVTQRILATLVMVILEILTLL